MLNAGTGVRRSLTAMPDPDLRPLERRLQELRARADEDHLAPPMTKVAGRHQLEIAELGLRVAVTRARYPNTAEGVDQYAVTVTRLALDQRPADPEVRTVLAAAFGDAAADAVERDAAGPVVRMFRVPAG